MSTRENIRLIARAPLHVGLSAAKPVFGVSDKAAKARLKAASSATENS